MPQRVRVVLRRHRRAAELIGAPAASFGVLVLVRALDLMADTPLWVLLGLIVATLVASETVRARWRHAMRVRVATLMLGIATVVYATGWGPVLAIGFMYGVAASVRTFGSRAARTAVVFALLGMLGGQLAVAAGLAPTVLEERLAHGLAVLGALGLGFPSWVVYFTAAQKEASEAKLQHQAFFDPLSQLPNRTLFVDRLGRALARTRHEGGRLAVLFLDLDRFKVVNDSLGHEVGDMLLTGVAHRVSASVRPTDTVARLGGDEFTVLLEDVSSVEDAVRVADRVHEALKLPFVLEGYEVVTSASVGIAMSDGEQGAEHLLRNADVAMYHAKRKGGARCEVFDAEMGVRAMQRLELEGRLRRAIEDRDVALHFQPEVALPTGEIVGVEALVRWSDPDEGLVPLDDVIALAEETGLIVPLGRWVLEQACAQARSWFSQLPARRPTVVAVNISTRQFQQPDLVDQVSATLGASGLDAHRLRVEVTESAMMQDVERSLGVIRNLRDLGLQIAVDDFGTGHSSLSYLSEFPADVLKLDRSFVHRLGTEPEITAIVEAVVTMAHRLGMQVIAEGVETVLQLAHLLELGCDTSQGYLFSPPIPPEEVEVLLRSGPFPVESLIGLPR